MKITYVIGNGFDAGLGLKTTYRDFLENHYLGIKNSSPSAERLKEVIKRDIDAWSDAELALGKIDVQKFEQAKGNVYPGAFYSAYYDFREEMRKYLKGCEDKVVDVVDEDVSYRFRQTLLSIHTGLSSEDRKRIDFSDGERIDVNFVNFNYTKTVEKLLGSVNVAGLFVRTVKINDKDIQVEFHSPIYVHKTLDEQEIVFGVDSHKQIRGFGEGNHRNEIVYQLLLKKDRENVRNGGGVERKAWDVLAQSDIIVLFGVSLGRSDAYWWEGIRRILSGRRNVIAIYSSYFKEDEIPATREDCVAICRAKILGAMVLNIPNDKMSDLRNVVDRFLIIDHGPHYDFADISHYCDPLHLQWFATKIRKH